uniref:Integrase catalytic domain-containing protein n=1 Tax=Amphimedon queenslandica TaxID=400682 RepID=A0A1X7V1X3_AMPQE
MPLEPMDHPVLDNAGFGDKLHHDQNKKLVILGVTHVMAVDGYSGIIVSYVIMPVKNNLLIYDHIYRKAVFTYGLGEQIRVDYGRIDPLLHGLETSH